MALGQLTRDHIHGDGKLLTHLTEGETAYGATGYGTQRLCSAPRDRSRVARDRAACSRAFLAALPRAPLLGLAHARAVGLAGLRSAPRPMPLPGRAQSLPLSPLAQTMSARLPTRANPYGAWALGPAPDTWAVSVPILGALRAFPGACAHSPEGLPLGGSAGWPGAWPTCGLLARLVTGGSWLWAGLWPRCAGRYGPAGMALVRAYGSAGPLWPVLSCALGSAGALGLWPGSVSLCWALP